MRRFYEAPGVVQKTHELRAGSAGPLFLITVALAQSNSLGHRYPLAILRALLLRLASSREMVPGPLKAEPPRPNGAGGRLPWHSTI